MRAPPGPGPPRSPPPRPPTLSSRARGVALPHSLPFPSPPSGPASALGGERRKRPLLPPPARPGPARLSRESGAGKVAAPSWVRAGRPRRLSAAPLGGGPRGRPRPHPPWVAVSRHTFPGRAGGRGTRAPAHLCPPPPPVSIGTRRARARVRLCLSGRSRAPLPSPPPPSPAAHTHNPAATAFAPGSGRRRPGPAWSGSARPGPAQHLPRGPRAGTAATPASLRCAAGLCSVACLQSQSRRSSNKYAFYPEKPLLKSKDSTLGQKGWRPVSLGLERQRGRSTHGSVQAGLMKFRKQKQALLNPLVPSVSKRPPGSPRIAASNE